MSLIVVPSNSTSAERENIEVFSSTAIYVFWSAKSEFQLLNPENVELFEEISKQNGYLKKTDYIGYNSNFV